eukprot:Tbor_TRINITY_DN8270_c0_g1::TRINITY_DN8270_c0_g1_i1::g.15379::m.15379/K17260/ACTR2, ARP2; actin-related protein 2
MSVNNNTVVLDNGTGFLKIGFAGANFPTAVFQNAIGRPILRSGGKLKNSTGTGLKEIMRGDETIGLSNLLEMSYPVSNGVIQKMDEMILLWDYAFHNKMNLSLDQIKENKTSIMLSEPPSFSNRHRTEMYEVMFEKYGFESIQSSPQGVLSLYANGNTTGIVIDCGEGVTHCTPVFEGYGLPKANRRVDLGGRNITNYLLRLMQRRGYHFNPSSDFETIRAIKEKFCYAAVDFTLEKRLAIETTTLEKAMTLPDGTTVHIGQERFEATEALFNPGLIDVECDGLSEQLWGSIQAADIDIRSRLYEKVVLSGGSTMFPGLPSRVEKDIRGMFLEKSLNGDKSRLAKFKISIEDSSRRKFMVFLGGAVMAKLSEDDADHWFSRRDWEEGGPSALRVRFGGA